MSFASFFSSFTQGIKPSPIMTVSEWADRYRVLPATSAEKGKYRVSRTPYLREPMDCLSVHSPVRVVVIVKPTQVGATEAANNFLFYVADLYPGPCMMVLPTTELAKRHSKTKIATSLRAMPDLHAKIRDVTARGGDGIFIKEFPGGFWTFVGSNSPTIFRSTSIQYLILDDEDGYEADVGGEGDTGALAKKRTDSYSATCKWLLMSTPTIRGLSRVERDYETTDQGVYYVPCPFCGEEQPLIWGGTGYDEGIKFKHISKTTNVEDIYYLCRKCHKRIDEYHKPFMLENGIWIPKYPEIKTKRGFYLNSLYSPLGWVSWKKIAEEFLEAKKKPELLKVWVNTRDGRSFELEGEQPDWVSLRDREEDYCMNTVPQGGLILTMGVDVQINRLAVVVLAFGRNEECWVVLWTEIFGNPAQQEIWTDLDSLYQKAFDHAYGVGVHVNCMAIDSSDQTQLVYNYVRPRGPRIIAVKGSSMRGKPIISRPTKQNVVVNGAVKTNAVDLYNLGTDTTKYLIYARLQLHKKHNDGDIENNQISNTAMIHFPRGLGDDFYRQLTSEKIVTRYVKGYPVKEWILPSGARNEALDCFVYAYAAALHVGVHRANWTNIEQSLGNSIIIHQDSSLPKQAQRQISQSAQPPRPQRTVSHFISNTTHREN